MTRTRSRQGRGVPYLQVAACPDGFTGGQIVGIQLAFDLDVEQGPPQLIIISELESARSGTVTPDVAGPSGFLALGPVLAQVLEFHQAFDLPRERLPTAQVGDVLATLRVSLLREETEEFADATANHDIVAIADALADVVYVAYGSAVTYGIDLDAVIAEVHRSNMSKLDERGRPILREDGKVLKSQRYRPPQLNTVLEEQLPLFDDTGSERGGPAEIVGGAS